MVPVPQALMHSHIFLHPYFPNIISDFDLSVHRTVFHFGSFGPEKAVAILDHVTHLALACICESVLTDSDSYNSF